MTKLLYSFCILLLLSDNLNAQDGPFQYEIQGQISELEDSALVVIYDPFSFDGYFESDTTLLINEQFQFKGRAIVPQQIALSYLNSAESFIFWLDSGTIQIKGKMGQLKNAHYIGSQLPQQIVLFTEKVKPYNDSLAFIRYQAKSTHDPISLAELKLKEQYFNSTILQESVEVIIGSPQSYYAQITLYRIRFELGEKKFDSLYQLVLPYWIDSPAANLLAKYRIDINSIQPGRPFRDIELHDRWAQEFNLSQHKGKYIYLDFWASYCEPCIKKFPYLNELHAQSDTNKLIMVSISVDQDSKKWEKALERFELHFQNYILSPNKQDLRESVINSLQLETIPRSFLIGPDYKLILLNPSDEELEHQLRKLKLIQ